MKTRIIGSKEYIVLNPKEGYAINYPDKNVLLEDDCIVGNVNCLSLIAKGNLDCEGSLDCEGNLDCEGSLDCEGYLYCEGFLDCKGYLYCKGNLDCKGYLHCEGFLYCKGYLYCKGNLDCEGNLYCEGSLHCEGFLYCEGNLHCKGNLDCEGSLDCNSLFIKKICKWEILLFNADKKIKIGCKTKLIHEWVDFFKNKQSFETNIDSRDYELIKINFKMALDWVEYLNLMSKK